MRTFKVDDEVWSFQGGTGVVYKVTNEPDYPLNILNERETDAGDDDENCKRYTVDGRFMDDDQYVTLYHIEDAKRLFPIFFKESLSLEDKCQVDLRTRFKQNVKEGRHWADFGKKFEIPFCSRIRHRENER
jgi:hypothetical protein